MKGSSGLHHDGVAPLLHVLFDEGLTVASRTAQYSYMFLVGLKWVQRAACLNPFIPQQFKQDDTDNARSYIMDETEKLVSVLNSWNKAFTDWKDSDQSYCQWKGKP